MSVSFTDIKAMLAAKPATAKTIPAEGPKILQGLQHEGIILSPEWIDAVQNLATLQQKDWPVWRIPRVALYVANYGENLEAIQARLKILAAQQDPLTRLCVQINADLRVYELDLSAQVPDGGLSEEEAAHAMSYGLMAVEEHVDCLVIDPISPGSDAVLDRWQTALVQENSDDALNVLRSVGAGHDLFALLGAVFAAYMAGIPVIIGARLATVLRWH